MTVFKEYYEIVGADMLAKAQAFDTARGETQAEQWALVKKLGGGGYRPGGGGGISTIFFAKGSPMPKGYRKVGSDGGQVECKPVRNTKLGKEICAAIQAAPRIRDWGAFADEFCGWKGRSPMDTKAGRGFIYHATGVAVARPQKRFFLQLPRELKDGWTPPEGIKEVRESDMLRAIEDHNAAVAVEKRKRAA